MTRPARRTQAERVADSARQLRIAFAELVIERGYERTTAADVGERAGYSRAMVRERFGSKADLLAALQSDFERAIFEPAPGVDGPCSGLDLVLAGFDALAGLVRAEPLMVRALFVVGMESVTTAHVFREIWLAAVARVRSSFTAWLVAGRDDGSVRAELDDADVADIVDEIAVAALGAAFLWAQDGDRVAYLDRIARYREVFRSRCAAV